MKAVLLAAGEGKRMHPLTYTRPKVMLPIANRPIMEHLILEMKDAGIRDFVLIVGYHGETIREHFGTGEKWDVSIDYILQRKQLGTAHAVKLAQRAVDGKFVLANGDVLIRSKDIDRILAKDDISLCLTEVQDTAGLGVIEIADSRIRRIHEKVARPPSNLVNAGLYLMTSEIFSAIDRTTPSPRGEFELTDSLQVLLDEGRNVSWVKIEEWLDMSYPWDLLAANELLMKNLKPKIQGTVEENVVLKGAVSIGKNTVVRSNSYLIGPVIIAENCDIGPGSYVRPCTTVADNCHIGASVEVKNSIIMRGTKIPHHNYIGDSVIGEDCNFGAGTKIANLRLDKKEIAVANIGTKRRKLGAMIGDGVQTGINASINVGSLIGNHTFIGPGAVVSGVVLPNSRIL